MRTKRINSISKPNWNVQKSWGYRQYSSTPSFFVDKKPVFVFDNKNIPKKSVLENVYKNINDSRKIPVVIESKKQYLMEYIRNQERLKKTDYPKQQEQEYVKQELKSMQPVVARYTTKKNRFVEPRVVIFTDHKLSDNQLKDTLEHEYAHELYERNKRIRKDWKSVNKDTSPTEYGKTDREEDFADSYSMYKNGRLQDARRAEIIDRDVGKDFANPLVIKKAKKRFGTTNDPREAGYILPDGTLLDFSAKNDGGTRGVRGVDHRQVYDVVGQGGNEGMDKFIQSTDAIRVSPSSKSLAVSVESWQKPTKEQRKSLDFVQQGVGAEEIAFDVYDEKGNIKKRGYAIDVDDLIRNVSPEPSEVSPEVGEEAIESPKEGEEKDSVPLKDAKFITVYHGTSKKNATKILREGLKPQLQDSYISYKRTYLTPQPDKAIEHAQAGPESEIQRKRMKFIKNKDYEGLKIFDNREQEKNTDVALLKITIPIEHLNKTNELLSLYDEEDTDKSTSDFFKSIYEFSTDKKITPNNIKEIEIIPKLKVASVYRNVYKKEREAPIEEEAMQMFEEPKIDISPESSEVSPEVGEEETKEIDADNSENYEIDDEKKERTNRLKRQWERDNKERVRQNQKEAIERRKEKAQDALNVVSNITDDSPIVERVTRESTKWDDTFYEEPAKKSDEAFEDEEEFLTVDNISDDATLYHGTSRESYHKIKKHGLQPYANYWGNPAVFLTPSVESARHYAKNGGVVLKVHVPDEELEQMGHSDLINNMKGFPYKQVRLERPVSPLDIGIHSQNAKIRELIEESGHTLPADELTGSEPQEVKEEAQVETHEILQDIKEHPEKLQELTIPYKDDYNIPFVPDNDKMIAWPIEKADEYMIGAKAVPKTLTKEYVEQIPAESDEPFRLEKGRRKEKIPTEYPIKELKIQEGMLPFTMMDYYVPGLTEEQEKYDISKKYIEKIEEFEREEASKLEAQGNDKEDIPKPLDFSEKRYGDVKYIYTTKPVKGMKKYAAEEETWIEDPSGETEWVPFVDDEGNEVDDGFDEPKQIKGYSYKFNIPAASPFSRRLSEFISVGRTDYGDFLSEEAGERGFPKELVTPRLIGKEDVFVKDSPSGVVKHPNPRKKDWDAYLIRYAPFGMEQSYPFGKISPKLKTKIIERSPIDISQFSKTSFIDKRLAISKDPKVIFSLPDYDKLSSEEKDVLWSDVVESYKKISDNYDKEAFAKSMAISKNFPTDRHKRNYLLSQMSGSKLSFKFAEFGEKVTADDMIEIMGFAPKERKMDIFDELPIYTAKNWTGEDWNRLVHVEPKIYDKHPYPESIPLELHERQVLAGYPVRTDIKEKTFPLVVNMAEHYSYYSDIQRKDVKKGIFSAFEKLKFKDESDKRFKKQILQDMMLNKGIISIKEYPNPSPETVDKYLIERSYSEDAVEDVFAAEKSKKIKLSSSQVKNILYEGHRNAEYVNIIEPENYQQALFYYDALKRGRRYSDESGEKRKKLIKKFRFNNKDDYKTFFLEADEHPELYDIVYPNNYKDDELWNFIIGRQPRLAILRKDASQDFINKAVDMSLVKGDLYMVPELIYKLDNPKEYQVAAYLEDTAPRYYKPNMTNPGFKTALSKLSKDAWKKIIQKRGVAVLSMYPHVQDTELYDWAAFNESPHALEFHPNVTDDLILKLIEKKKQDMANADSDELRRSRGEDIEYLQQKLINKKQPEEKMTAQDYNMVSYDRATKVDVDPPKEVVNREYDFKEIKKEKQLPVDIRNKDLFAFAFFIKNKMHFNPDIKDYYIAKSELYEKQKEGEELRVKERPIVKELINKVPGKYISLKDVEYYDKSLDTPEEKFFRKATLDFGKYEGTTQRISNNPNVVMQLNINKEHIPELFEFTDTVDATKGLLSTNEYGFKTRMDLLIEGYVGGKVHTNLLNHPISKSRNELTLAFARLAPITLETKNDTIFIEEIQSDLPKMFGEEYTKLGGDKDLKANKKLAILEKRMIEEVVRHVENNYPDVKYIIIPGVNYKLVKHSGSQPIPVIYENFPKQSKFKSIANYPELLDRFYKINSNYIVTEDALLNSDRYNVTDEESAEIRRIVFNKPRLRADKRLQLISDMEKRLQRKKELRRKKDSGNIRTNLQIKIVERDRRGLDAHILGSSLTNGEVYAYESA